MKCPKCKYNTFEFLDSCKKCGADLRSFKESLGIRPIILSSRRESPPVETATPTPGEATRFGAESQVSEDTFCWDTPQSSPSQETEGADAEAGLDSHSEPPAESFSFETSFGDLPGFEENNVEDFKEKGETAPSTTIGEFALDDFLKEKKSAGSPPQSDASYTQTDTFASAEFDVLFENDPVAGQNPHQG